MTDRKRALFLLGLVVIALVGAAWFQWRRVPVPSIRLSASTDVVLATATVPPTSTPSPLRIYISGGVRYPDVYVLPPGSIVQDALLAAGGASDDADLDRINLAALVVDGQHVYVPRAGEAVSANPPSGASRAGAPSGGPGGLVNINTATAVELETLPGIGPALASAIVTYRETNGPFATVEDIIEVPGIGPAILAKIRDLITTN